MSGHGIIPMVFIIGLTCRQSATQPGMCSETMLIPRTHFLPCAGVLYARNCTRVSEFVTEWDSVLMGHVSRVAQIAFDTLVTMYTTPLQALAAGPRVATGPDSRIRVGVLPSHLFANGHTYFVQHLHKVRP